MSFSDKTAHSYGLCILELTHNITLILDADVQMCLPLKKEKTCHHLSLKTGYDCTATEKAKAHIWIDPCITVRR